ncbi:MAG: ornithine carbamoyltransferase [Bacteroidetes bacterium]|nr:ornithine carbamoyltransferase [Bacteroidota bacterium]
MKKKDFISIANWSAKELLDIITLSYRIKKTPHRFSSALKDRAIALIFEKQSLRTHVAFELGAKQLGAHTVYLTNADISLGKRESIYDVTKNLERWLDAAVVRTYDHKYLEQMASTGKLSIINALSDFEHPCQAVGDFMTILEKLKTVKKKKFAWVGDGNNVCHSLMLLAAKLGMDFTAVTPEKFEPDTFVTTLARDEAQRTKASIVLTNDPTEGVRNADIVYTDVWVSMGEEAHRDEKIKAFVNYQVTTSLMKLAKPTALFMHCLPAHRGEEVTDEVIDSPQSIVFEQAENRLYSQKAILVTLLRKKKTSNIAGE